MKISNKSIGNNFQCFIIAEGCDNHMGDLEVAREMSLRAKLSGADAIKFQHHLPDEEMLKNIHLSDNFEEPLYDFLLKNALKIDDHIALKSFCDEIGIIYLCTPFSYKAACELMDLDVPCFKIGSGEMTDIPSLKKIADLGKPMILSTGMSTIEEIKLTYNELKALDVEFALLNCVSEYPPVYEDVNLGFIPKMYDLFPNVVIGHSDHTPDIYTCFGAVTLGAKIIEKHVIIDKRTPGPDQSVSIDFTDLKQLVDGVRKIEASLGAEKIIHDKEKQIREWAFRSVVAVRNIPEGQKITEDDLWTKRPGTGIPSKEMPKIIGCIAKRDIQQNTLLTYSDYEKKN
jgi:sialic acid synthase SpsE